MSEVDFRIEYDGPALEDHVMDVRMLAPSLLAFRDLCRETGRQIYGDQTVVQVNVVATSEGSFAAVLKLIVETVQKAVDNPAVDVAMRVIEFCQSIREGTYRADLSFDFQIQAYWKFVAPLQVQGTTEIRISLNYSDPVETIRQDDIVDRDYYIEPLLRLRTMTVREEGWQFLYNGTQIDATMRDSKFLDRVVAGEESFGAYDYFHVLMRVIHTRLDNGAIQETYEIIAVRSKFSIPRDSLKTK